MNNKTYYGEYDFKILAEKSQSANIQNNRSNFKHKILSKNTIEPTVNKITNSFNKDSLYINELDMSNIQSITGKEMINATIVKMFENNTIKYKLSFGFINNYGNDSRFMYFIQNNQIEPTILIENNEIKCSFTIDSSNILYNYIKNFNNTKILIYRYNINSPLPISFVGYPSDNFTTKQQFLSMESFEGKITIDEDIKYMSDKFNDILFQNYKQKEKTYKITIIEQEYDKSILSLFDDTINGKYIKITKLYDDRIEEYFNCELSNSPSLNEAEDVNTRDIELISDFCYIRYFNNDLINIEGDVI